MYKYYWNGKLVRTSKTRGNYTHAVLRVTEDGKIIVWGCASSYVLAQRAMSSAVRVNVEYHIVELERG